MSTRAESRSPDQISALNASAKAAFETLSRRFDAQEEKLKASDVKIVKLETAVTTMAGSLASLVQLLQEQRDNPPPAAAVAAAAAQQQPQEVQQEEQQGALF